jgi:hypothetical protein
VFQRSLIFFVLSLFVLSGCAFNKVRDPSPEQEEEMKVAVEKIRVRADEAGSDGNVDDLEDDLRSLARRYPVSSLPWSALAKIRFDRDQYGLAIVAADEALQRDATDEEALYVHVAAGLRVAANSLKTLRGLPQRSAVKTKVQADLRKLRSSLSSSPAAPATVDAATPATTSTPTPAARPAAQTPPSSTTGTKRCDNPLCM